MLEKKKEIKGGWKRATVKEEENPQQANNTQTRELPGKLKSHLRFLCLSAKSHKNSKFKGGETKLLSCRKPYFGEILIRRAPRDGSLGGVFVGANQTRVRSIALKPQLINPHCRNGMLLFSMLGTGESWYNKRTIRVPSGTELMGRLQTAGMQKYHSRSISGEQ
uniref:Uncharacterized protein n=1 Tax=Coccidioides posadasii RMSCC 3488 TaxID=454284 RepID=A0A0J6FIV0_COCPO|nr:hypothetical protein CPAG_06545 [Coccidioides posadasii RMSCC 3488]